MDNTPAKGLNETHRGVHHNLTATVAGVNEYLTYLYINRVYLAEKEGVQVELFCNLPRLGGVSLYSSCGRLSTVT